MSNKMKGLLKGLRYISQIFDEEKDQDMEIGHPTDVKHVAHIGCDGAEAGHDSPSWGGNVVQMKEFSSTSTGFSGPSEELKDNPESKCASEDSKRSQRTKSAEKSSRRQSSTENNSNDQSPKKKDPSAKPRQSRRKEGKDPSDASESAADAPKKSRRKKSKELGSDGGSRGSRNRATASNGMDSCEDLGPEPGPGFEDPGSQLSTESSADDKAEVKRVTFRDQ